jgi:hypothetical protein
MVKSCKRKSKRHNKSKRHRQRGGELAGNPPSAWGWGLGTMGDGWTQFMDSLTLQSNQNGNMNQSNNIVPVGNASIQSKVGGRKRKYRGGNHHTSMSGSMPGPMSGSMPGPMSGSMPGPMSGSMSGSMSVPVDVSMSALPVSALPVSASKSGGKKRGKRGGNVFAQAIVPGTLILMNNALGKFSRKRHH